MPPMNRPPHQHTLTNQLSREWEHLRRRPSELARARSWRVGLEPGTLARTLDALSDLDQIIRASESPSRSWRSTGPSRPGAGTAPASRPPDPVDDRDADAVLRQLVEIARHDQLAGRIVIQRLLPGLISFGARYRSHHEDVDPAELCVAAAWIAIHRYDTCARPHHVAPALISDATFQAFRQPLRRRSATDAVVPVEHFDQQPSSPDTVTAFEQLADVIRLARTRGVAASELQLVRDLVQGGSATAVAARHGVTARTIRNRRDRAVANIRRAVAAA